jgi:anaerobic selenocysteine-containing dehydrogenase
MRPAGGTRRDFLKSSARAAGAAVLGGPLLLRAAPESTAANSRIRIALVGCGSKGRGDMKGLLSRGAQLAALCDPDAAQLTQGARGCEGAGRVGRLGGRGLSPAAGRGGSL